MGFDQHINKVPKFERENILISWDEYDWYKTFSKDSEELAYFRKDYDLNGFFKNKFQYNVMYDNYVAVIISKNDLEELLDFLKEDSILTLPV